MKEQNNLSFRPFFAWALVAVLVSAFVALFVSFQVGVWILFFTIAAWWTWEHPEEGFLLLIVLAPLLPMMKITQTIGTATLIKDIIIGTLLLKLVLVPLVTKRLPYRRNVLFAPAAALLAWTAWETLRADSLLLGVLRARDIVLYLALFFAVLYLHHDPRTLHARFRWVSSVLLVVLALGVYQWFFAVDSAVLRYDPVRDVWIPRLSSILAHPSIFGQYVVFAAALFGGAALVGRKPQRPLFAALLLLLVPFVYLTYSRAVWLGLAVSLAVQSVVLAARLVRQPLPPSPRLRRASHFPLWKYAMPTVAGALLLTLLLIRFTPAGIFVRSAFDPTYGSNEERLEFLVRLIAPLSNTEALIGKGLGDVLAQNFRAVDVTTFDIATGDARAVQLTKNRTLVDNQYLKTLVEMGLTGLLIYVWLYWRFGKAAWQLSNDRTAAPGQRIIGLAAIGFLAAFVVQALFIDIWDIFPTNANFWIIAALVSAASAPRIKNPAARR